MVCAINIGLFDLLRSWNLLSPDCSIAQAEPGFYEKQKICNQIFRQSPAIEYIEKQTYRLF